MSQNVKVYRTLEFYHSGGGGRLSTIDVDDSSTILYWRPETDDTGYISFGDGTKDFDLKWFGGATTKYVLFDVGDVYLYLEDVDLKLGDNDVIRMGDASGGDVAIDWNGSLLRMLPVANDTGYFSIGNGVTDFDFVVQTGAGKYMQVDVGNDYFSLVNLSMYAPNLTTSSGQAGIIYVNSAGYLIQSD